MQHKSIRVKIIRQAVASFFLVQISTLILSEVFSQMYNPTREAGYGERLLLAFNPSLLVFVTLICTVAGFLLAWYLRPLWRELARDPAQRTEKSGAQARKVVVSLPWTLLSFNTAVWTIAIFLFYFMHGGTMPSGMPLGWVLAIKLSESLAATFVNAFLIDTFLKEPKQYLNIHAIGTGETDHFINGKTILIPFVSGIFMITHLAFITEYFLQRNPNGPGPSSPIVSIIAVGIVLLGITHYMAWLARKQDTIQFELLNHEVLTLASGETADLNKKVDIINFNETGRITESLNSYLEVLRRMVGRIRNGCNALRENESGLSASMYEAEEKLREITATVRSTEDQIETQLQATADSSKAAETINGRVQEVHRAVIRQTASVGESSAGIEQMIASIASVSANVETINRSCRDLLDAANRGKSKINDSNTLIGRVMEASAVLLDANRMIASIAAQTNLLAMNAAIEAAHAGDAGSGFAVVAGEIRSLAEKSAGQSAVVNAQLKEVRQAIETAVGSSGEASAGFDEVLELIEAVTAMEQENIRAMQEQKSGSDQVAATLHEMKQATDVVQAAAGTLAGESTQLHDAVSRLVACSDQVKNRMDEVLRHTLGMNVTFEEVSALKENNNEIFKDLTHQVDRFVL